VSRSASPGFFCPLVITRGVREFMPMSDEIKKNDRRSFLRGSALFAAALGASVVPALAQQEKPKPKPQSEEEEKPADPLGSGEKSKDGKLYDKEGREYKICPQCGYNMYKQGRMWICENCGYSYVE
jgi:ribosomal protein S27AE